ncbi:hypothetical protein NE237_023373 [Protea cynaroides]|uniref:Protein SIEVE ELEMENT OCCLUSION B-like n=1 Tax=Protea cynaroides TaxID=273540 RepID=A0A9Q0HCT5_9MAGN|nr:hypothetical protein NE237_023373 [Protea cynaroides]
MAKFPTPELEYSIDEQEIIEKLEAKYVRKNRDFEYKHLMDVIKNIFHSCNLVKNGAPIPLENADYELKDDIRYTINKLSWKITCNSACEMEIDKTVHELLDFLSGFSWDATVVLMLAVLAMNHGELLLLKQSTGENRIAKFVQKLKNPPPSLGSNEDLKLYVEEPLKNLVDQMLGVAEQLVQFKEQASTQKIELSSSLRKVFCIATYQIVQSVVKCISSTMEFVKSGDKYQDFPTKIQQIIRSCRFTAFRDYLKNSKFFELEYNGIVWAFKQANDVAKLLLSIFNAKGNLIRQFDGINKMKSVLLDDFQGNTVGFFITEFNVKEEDFSVLKDTYNQVRENGFEILWIPVLDQSIEWKDELLDDLEKVARMMPWWSLTYLLSRSNPVWWYIKQDWQFQRTPMLVVLDKYAKVIHTNALPMVNYWREEAFPFSMETEVMLWREKSPTIIKIIEKIQPLPQIKQGEIICVYGSHDMSWVHDFLCFINHLEMKDAEVKTTNIYVGTNRRKQISKKFGNDQNSIFWCENMMLRFWRDLENVAASKMIQGRENLVDAIKNEFATILSYDEKEEGWALMFNESSKFILFSGKQLKYCWKNKKDWMGKVHKGEDIMNAMTEYLQPLKLGREHCIHLAGPTTINNLVVACPECGRTMEKSFVYKCCVK